MWMWLCISDQKSDTNVTCVTDDVPDDSNEMEEDVVGSMRFSQAFSLALHSTNNSVVESMELLDPGDLTS